MGESPYQHNHLPASSSRFGMRHRDGRGEVVEVQGGHIVRSTGRKDRHSKVCTAKGPRDRRVRLSAHTAIQFYDVQDRLGYDRPSKAVDWLIKKAKTAIDELAELPPWNPETVLTTAKSDKLSESTCNEGDYLLNTPVNAAASSGTCRSAATVTAGDIHHNLQEQEMGQNPNSNNSGFMRTSMESDPIEDTIKSCFPIGSAAEAPSPPQSMQFQCYPLDLTSRHSNQSEDLRLSLQSFQESPLLLQHHQQPPETAPPVLFSGTGVALGGFDGSSSGWEHHHHPVDINGFQRIMNWGSGGSDAGTGGVVDGGCIFGSPPVQIFGGQNSQLLCQRGTLQSSNTPSVRAWVDQPMSATDEDHHQIHQAIHYHQSAVSGIVFPSSGSSSSFRIPARLQGQEEKHDDGPSNPSSASSDSGY